MTRGPLVVFIGVFALLACSAHAAVSESRTLAAIAAVESGNRPDAIGQLGERSAFQFMETTWRRYTSAPFERASTDPRLAATVAHLHFAAIVRRLERSHRPVTVRAIAYAWNPGAPRDYADRIVNLAEASK